MTEKEHKAFLRKWFRCPTLTTERLTLRRLLAKDRAFHISLDTNPDVMQFIHHGLMPREMARFMADIKIEAARRNANLHRWIIERTDDQARLGWVELSKYEQGYQPGAKGDDIQIAYQLAPSFWYCGYATEACRAVIAYGFDSLTLDRVAAFARPENCRSTHLLEKLGFLGRGKCRDDAGHHCGFYYLTRKRWQALHQIRNPSR